MVIVEIKDITLAFTSSKAVLDPRMSAWIFPKKAYLDQKNHASFMRALKSTLFKRAYQEVCVPVSSQVLTF